MTQNKKGFTLLELLITIGIIAILSVAIVFVLNPSETLKKSRDSQRLSDLSNLKTAIALYTSSIATPYLSGTSTNTGCKPNAGWGAGGKIFYSLPSSSSITDTSLDGGPGYPAASQVAASSSANTDGTGWIPVELDAIQGGSPISAIPIDPVNTITNLTAVASTDLVYRYACRADNLTFEIDSSLESYAFTVDDDRRTKDGGNNSSLYEVGTNLKILGSGTDF